MTKTETVLVAFKALVATAAPTLPPLLRNVNTFARTAEFTVTPDGGDPITADVGFVLFDGNATTPEDRLSPDDYEIEHAAELEILVTGAHCDAVFDHILATVGDLVAANRVSAAWEFLACGVPERDFAPGETHDQGKGCTLPILFTFRSAHPF